ncbi:MAG: Crp/Fnr family transcriptional regulator [Flavobacteriales bacterium]
MSDQSLQHYISSYFGVDKKDLDTISSLFKEEEYSKGDFYLKQEGRCDKLSFIHSGMFRIYHTTMNKEVTQWISTQGYFITDLSSLMFETPARWSIQALSDTQVYTISRADYRRIGNLVPSWHELEKLFIAKCFTILEDRIFSHLSMSAEDRYLMFYEKNKELFHQVPLQYLASMLGMTPETFSRIRKKQLK